MNTRNRLFSAGLLSIAVALSGCMNPGEDAAGARPHPSSGLDENHGGARILLPEIDPAALGKAGVDTAPLPSAWFELGISGENMQAMSFRYPLPDQNGKEIAIKGIPAGRQRRFHGRLVNGKGILTHEGATLADIQAGAMADIRLFLAKASGSASVCVVIEGQKLPPCAVGDTLPPPIPPEPGAAGGCWLFSSGWISGKVALYDSVVNGASGTFRRDTGAALPITTWSRRGDTLEAILVSPDPSRKWLMRGIVLGRNDGWTGVLSDHSTGKTTSFGAKSLPCSLVADPGKEPIDTVPNPPKPLAGIPLPGSGAKQVTLCFEMRFDYADSACEIQGYAKMVFLDGKIPYGNLGIADRPNRTYMTVSGTYDSSAIRFYGISEADPSVPTDTLTLQGRIGTGGTLAKGDYSKSPSGIKGNWTMKNVECGAWTPKYPDPSCSAAKGP